MPWTNKKWVEVSLHDVVLAWLRAERANFNNHPQSALIASLLDSPDFNPVQNRQRLRLFYSIRNLSFVEIPPDTRWYRVHSLAAADLDDLHAINHANWNDPSDSNELLKVARRKNFALTKEPSVWDTRFSGVIRSMGLSRS